MSEQLRNQLLRALAPEDLDRLKPDLEMVHLDLRFVLETANQPIRHVYFPESGFVSVVAKTKGDRTIEVGLIGREGMSGVSVVMGDDRSANDTFVQYEGTGSRIPAEKLREAMESSPSLRKCLLHYVQAFLCQTSQSALTNGRAAIGERLARWILMAHDRVDGDALQLTHEFLALMLGVRRPGVTDALHFLEGKGLIRSARGKVTVLDRTGLEQIADGSYGVPEMEYARLFGDHSSGIVRMNRAP
ncbi:CRP-like cAMP-binding protein [Constrictibacter sp. MBR-5]|uniref:Crp/Fnr family transcriptional regulator n=1 Tax=Constrictibacter sp. MBR-5 TaxID=3156467 RepID=UPI00339AB3E8